MRRSRKPTAGPARSTSTRSAAGSSRSQAWVDRFESWRDELRRKVEAGQTDLASELQEGAALLEGARARRRRPRSPSTETRPVRGDRGSSARSRSTSTASSPASAPGTSSSRARGAASRASRRCCPSSPSSASTSSTCRRSTRSAGRTARAATTRSTAGAGRPGQPVGDRRARRAATRRSIPELGTIEDFDRLVAPRAHSSGLEIALDFAIQCSPDHPWLKEHPGVVPPPPGRDAEVRGEPAEALPGHLQRQLRQRGLAGAVGGAARRRPALGRARRAGLPRRQPAHEAAAVLGVADRGGARGRPGRRLPLRGVHAAGDDGRAREGRLQPVVHLLHLEEHEGGADRVHDAS